jgi:beta-N-acetylhexosaminidase
LLNRLQEDAKVPLLIGADFERGVSMRLRGSTEFPHSMAFGAAGKLEYAEAFGRITAQEARAVGIHWNFFPDADVNSNPVNPIINTRSFGEDPKQVGDLVAAYIRGARANGMMTTAKHFPGHGDTATDSHMGVAQVNGDAAHLQSIELPPFRQAIEAGVDSVMVAHVTAPALDPDPNHVATTSPAVVDGLLKKQLGFNGLVVTDALDMGALTRHYAAQIGRASVDAFKAGNDVLLIPADIAASYQAVLSAVQSGEIPLAQLDASVLKILKAKASVGLNKSRTVDLDQLPEAVGKPENKVLGQQIADEAVALVRNNGQILPLKAQGTVRSSLPYQKEVAVRNDLVTIMFTDDLRNDAGSTLERQIRQRFPTVNVLYVDSSIAAAKSPDILAAIDQAKTVIAAVFAAPDPGSTTTTYGMLSKDGLLQKVLDHAAQKTVVVAMGNPYIASDFTSIQTYLCTFSNTAVSELSAAKALFGEIAIRGRLPVTIPNIAQRGSGIDLPAHIAKGGQQHARSQSVGQQN